VTFGAWSEEWGRATSANSSPPLEPGDRALEAGDLLERCLQGYVSRCRPERDRISAMLHLNPESRHGDL
jgi:hypothetical protein